MDPLSLKKILGLTRITNAPTQSMNGNFDRCKFAFYFKLLVISTLLYFITPPVEGKVGEDRAPNVSDVDA